MTKRSDIDFLGLYRAILTDVSAYFPDDQVEWDRDMSHLTRLSSARGSSTFTMDLPALGKILDKSLSAGLLVLNGENLSGSRHPNSKIPRLFWGLWIRLFDDTGCLKSDIDPNVVLFLRTLLYVGKNLKSDCSPRYLYDTVKEFYDVEATLPPASDFWRQEDCSDGCRDFGHLRDFVNDTIDGRSLFGSTKPDRPTSVLNEVQRLADLVSTAFGTFDPSAAEFRHGPGAVSDNRTGSYKYDFPGWSRRLESVFPFSEYGTTGLGLMEYIDHNGYTLDDNEVASKLIAVPKTQKGPRLIASEPTAHQWCQQSIRQFLTEGLGRLINPLHHCIDLDDQEPSRRMALSASRSGQYATVDLKSASDRVTCQLVQRIFRRNLTLLEAFRASRTRFIVNSIDKKSPKVHELRKFTTQGSALTFPVQSIVFATICIGVGRFLHPTWSYDKLARQVRVFGDDIIIPNSWEPLVRETLQSLYLRVNDTKTHAQGFFRESCGMDAFAGYDVTPPYYRSGVSRSNPETIASAVAVANNFYKKGFLHAARYMQRLLDGLDIPTINRRSGAFGFISNSGFEPTYLKNRWNSHLHRWEVRVLSIFAKSLRQKQDSAQALLQFFTEFRGDPEPYLGPFMDYDSGVAVRGVPVMRHTWVPLGELVSN